MRFIPRSIVATAVAVVLLVPAAPAAAAVFYTFDPAGPTGTNYAVTLAPGASVSLPVFAAFTGTDAALLVDERGLFSADVRLLRIDPAASDPVAILGAYAVAPNPAFDEPLGPVVTYAGGGDVDLFQSVATPASTGVLGSSLAADLRAVLLGRFTFTAGATAGQTTTFRALDLPGFDDTVTLANNIILDPRIGEATVTFNVVPGGGPGGPGPNIVPLPGGLPLAGATLAWAAVFLRGGRRCQTRDSHALKSELGRRKTGGGTSGASLVQR